jgi:hypothetical protein
MPLYSQENQTNIINLVKTTNAIYIAKNCIYTVCKVYMLIMKFEDEDHGLWVTFLKLQIAPTYIYNKFM